jgi:hypothetical protein
MENPSFPKETLIIDTTRSYCNNCGKGVHPRGRAHITNDGWNGGGKGCGVIWKYVASNYIFIPNLKETILKMRPDLEWVGYDEEVMRVTPNVS